MSANDEHFHARRPTTRPPHGGWTELQRREGAAVLRWLQTEQRLQKGFDALAIALRATLDDLVRTASDACAVWRAAPKVLGDCNNPETYSIPQAETAYAWLHMLDRYVRTWLALEHLVRSSLLPMGKLGIRALDVGTGPGPSAFATHDFFAALEEYALATASPHWRQPPDIMCVECAPSMNHIRHLLAEHLAITGTPRSVLAMTRGLHDFGSLHPARERGSSRTTCAINMTSTSTSTGASGMLIPSTLQRRQIGKPARTIATDSSPSVISSPLSTWSQPSKTTSKKSSPMLMRGRSSS